ncbi:nitroreductase family protein [Lederbergia galactosidilytica]|uniref:Nitroreductase n=1 Tax=Lederbergia galactosidilytica TaxID=217031 RepID=A0A177ZIE6_9BACI|nr:nitroreductase family protein [Lederbergia galactosidilytica]KRG16508.1 nitroreductase [Virgibacillus soli]MBP1914158.1 nitroreductase [Lederbergia galactosidilytica]OAK67383.1 nitroreductase [Lederbergia galactosidilytica]
MSVLDVIRSRREATNFQGKQIPQEILKDIIDSAYYAPSGNNLLSREFIIVESREMLDYLEKTTPFMKWMATAQVAIIVTGRPDVSKYWLQDASIASAFIWLGATDLGIGVGFGAVYHSEDERESETRESYVRNALHIPEDRRIVAILGMGFPEGEPKEKKLLKREETIFFEKFGQED